MKSWKKDVVIVLIMMILAVYVFAVIVQMWLISLFLMIIVKHGLKIIKKWKKR